MTYLEKAKEMYPNESETNIIEYRCPGYSIKDASFPCEDDASYSCIKCWNRTVPGCNRLEAMNTEELQDLSARINQILEQRNKEVEMLAWEKVLKAIKEYQKTACTIIRVCTTDFELQDYEFYPSEEEPGTFVLQGEVYH